MPFSQEQKTHFQEQISVLKQTLPTYIPTIRPRGIIESQSKGRDKQPDYVIENLVLFEEHLTLDELTQCFEKTAPEQLEKELTALLARRWERIRDSNASYTNAPFDPLNLFCLELAKALAPPANTEEEIDALKPLTGPYFLLMPSLKYSEDSSLQNIHKLKLHELILSDDGTLFVSIADCFDDASVSEEGKFRHRIVIDGGYTPPELSATELKRLTKHSEQATQLHAEILELNRVRLLGEDLGAKLTQLLAGLRAGRVGAGGVEYDSGPQANTAIAEFNEYWETLSEAQVAAIYQETPRLKEVIERLFRPNLYTPEGNPDAERAENLYTNVAYCIALIGDMIDANWDNDSILKHYQKIPALQELINRVQEKKNQLQTSLANPDTLVPVQETTQEPPKHLLHRIHQLDLEEQHRILNQVDAIQYAIEQDPEALLEFELSPEEKERIINSHVIGLPFLHAAASQGLTKVVDQLISWGAAVNEPDDRNRTPLMYAASKGHVETAAHLLDQGASLGLNAPDYQGATALHWAVRTKHKEMISLLFERGAELHLKDKSHRNPFEYALRFDYYTQDPVNLEILKTLLMHMVNLPAAEQTACLISGSQGYSNALFFAAQEQPKLFNSLVKQRMEHSNLGAEDPILTGINGAGVSPLLLAAKIGAIESLKSLSTLGLDIEACDLNGNNALITAALHGQPKAVELLLEQGAELSVRNKEGNNAFDLANRADSFKTTQILVTHLLRQPLEIQAECLSQDSYANAYEYLANSNQILSDLIKDTPLAQQGIDKHLNEIARQYKTMNAKAAKDENYQKAAETAQMLLKTCIDGLFTYKESKEENKLSTFLETCKTAVETSRPLLSKHRNMFKVVAAFLAALITFPVSIPLIAAGIFSTKTKSEQLLDKFQSQLDDHVKNSPKGGS